ncbi:MAG: dihydroorotate dehydrogenase [Gemmatimonadaceae bacterium]
MAFETNSVLATTVAGMTFRNPVLLAAGTAAFGREIADVVNLQDIGGIVTKAVSTNLRAGAPAPRVAEFDGGMINAVGLANPGVDEVRMHDLPWLASNARGARVIVNVVGDTTEDYAAVVRGLEGEAGVDAFELNVSCPNVKAGGMEFGADPRALSDVVGGARRATRLPLFVKLSPTLADIATMARLAADCGADAITLVNTLPGMVVDVEARRPALGFGRGGVSGPGLLPVGVLATWTVRRAVKLPLVGVGGIATEMDALQYLIAGASLVAIGTAAMKDPGVPARVVVGLERWCQKHGIGSVSEIVGSLEWPQ